MRKSISSPVIAALRWILMGLSLLFLALPSLSFAITDFYVPPPKLSKKKRLCCALGIAYKSGPGKVILEQVCMRPKASVFHFRLKNLPSTCTYPGATVLRDQDGRKYPMISHTGLPNCASKRLQTKANMSFTWIFERLKPNTRRISLVEALDPITQGMGHWHWRNVSLRHCKFN